MENKCRYSLSVGGNFPSLPSQFLWSGVGNACESGLRVISSDLTIGRDDHITSEVHLGLCLAPGNYLTVGLIDRYLIIFWCFIPEVTLFPLVCLLTYLDKYLLF